ncbi:hypothetical protein G3I59_21220 [Amycolatopsis rubida]|uniref:Helix-turn-helix domain-containing protein n=1 Tax=Amycolatopsis rubida TaxID=112413 RepID=A0ABX0BW90_9PSEU|nr:MULTISPECIES: hypothetical protein [Amycolatopsis]MYW93066.1 hypothetical protein [Amycolatopsis rubida]NEC58053.1 hypothetical protein [Amycolatopsis rubida]OAP21203.1 hypothetical protein A4R44_08179 [Amycolatopsis sp. M39]
MEVRAPGIGCPGHRSLLPHCLVPGIEPDRPCVKATALVRSQFSVRRMARLLEVKIAQVHRDSRSG